MEKPQKMVREIWQEIENAACNNNENQNEFEQQYQTLDKKVKK